MAERPYSYCREPGCLTRTRGSYCEAHATNNTAARNRAAFEKETKHDPIWRLYNCAAWFRFRKVFIDIGNSVCQRIDNGVQCRMPVKILHHIISPRKGGAMYSWTNVVGVCEHHHPNTEGEPVENLDKLDKIYVPTQIPRWMRAERKEPCQQSGPTK